jgi:alanine dehydrogenase
MNSRGTLRFLSAAETSALVAWPAAIRCMREAYANDMAAKAVPGRLIAAESTAWIRCMPAIPIGGRFMGTKQISRTRTGKLQYLITLFDRESGELAWMIDAIALTALRTAATSIAAVEMLTKPATPIDLAILGSGLEATKHLAAMAAARPIRSLRVYSPTEANRLALARTAEARYGINARASATAEEAVDGATHVFATARSRGELPIVHGAWLALGAVVVSVGSTIPVQREIDVSVVERASLIIADVVDEVASETGDMIAATKAGIAFAGKMFSLHDLALGRVPRERLDDGGIHLFKSVGSALQDIAIAELAVACAEQAGAGINTAIALELKQSIGRNA